MPQLIAKTNLRFWLLGFILIAINVSGILWIQHSLTTVRKPRFQVSSVSPETDAESADRVSLAFDEPVGKADWVGKIARKSPFKIDPPPPGYWMWKSPEVLEYVLEKPLPSGRIFKIVPSDELEAQTGFVLKGKSSFEIKTRALQVLSCRLDSVDRDGVNVEIKFNQKVDPSQFLEALHLNQSDVSGQALQPIRITKDVSDTFQFRTSRPSTERLVVGVDAKLTGAGGELPLSWPYTNQLTIKRAFSLLHAQVGRGGFSAERSSVVISFSSALDSAQTAGNPQVVPAVEGLTSSVNYGQLIIGGKFAPGVNYVITVSGDLVSKTGEKLGSDQNASFIIPEPEPTLDFADRGGILSPGGNMLVDLNIFRITEIEVRASQLYANNLVEWLHTGYGHRRHYGRDDYSNNDAIWESYGDANAFKKTSRDLPPKRIQVNTGGNAPRSVGLDLASVLEHPLGIYAVSAKATNAWQQSEMVVAITDLAITSKKERNGILAWVTSVKSAKPAEGVKISAISYTNQTLGTGVTNGEGTAHLSIPGDSPESDAYIIVAERDGDMNFLQPNQRPWMIDHVDQSGREVPSTYDVMLYPERGVYRPGDTVHLTGIVRGADGNLPPAFPLTVNVTRPDGKKIAELPATPDPRMQDTFQIDFVSASDGQTGPYKFAATLPGAEQSLGEVSANIETFAPVRIEVKAEPSQTFYAKNERPILAVSGRYLFDQPCAGLAVTATDFYHLTPFKSKPFPEFVFENQKKETASSEPVRAELDADGRAILNLNGLKDETPGLWEGSISTTVTDPGGRSVSKNATVKIDTAGRYIGVRVPAGKIVQTDKPFGVEWIERTAKDESAEPGPINLALSRIEYDWVVQKSDGRSVWKTVEQVSKLMGKTFDKDTITSDSIGRAEISCPQSGQYRLEVSDALSSSTAQVEFYASSWGGANETVAVTKPERLEIVLDQPSYAIGSKASVLVRSPFAGTLLLTVESDRVMDQRVIEMKANTERLELPIESRHRGGGFISATVVRPIDADQEKWMPHRAMGLARLRVDPKSFEIPIEIDAPKQIYPGQTVAVDLHAGTAHGDVGPQDEDKPAIVHLWAVDEGILLTTGFETPNPLKYFFADRKASVASADNFADLLPDNKRPLGIDRIGGGDHGEMERDLYRSPVEGKRREPAIVWRGVAALGRDGRARIEMKLPDMTGEMRLMAVVIDRDRYGSKETPVTMTGPLNIEIGSPRFASPHDVFAMPVKLFNTTDQVLSVNIKKIRLEGPIAIKEALESSISLEPKRTQTIWLKTEATGIGQASIRIEGATNAGSEGAYTATASAAFPVRPVAPLDGETRFTQADAGSELTIEPSEKFLPDARWTKVSVSGRPTVQLRPAIDQLIEYPYGCIEQTTSKLLGMLYAPDILLLDSPNDARARAVGDMVHAGIMRLWSMQTAGGGLSYWPGETHPYVWGSVYATSCLIEAKRAGHAVDKRFTDSLADYLEGILKGRIDENYQDRYQGQQHQVDDNTRAEICHALAGLSRPQMGWMARLSEQVDQLDIAGRAHLAGAWLEAGDKDHALAVLTDDTVGKSVQSTTSGRLTSQTHQDSVLLGVLIQIDPNHKWIPALVRRLEEARKNGKWRSTLENSGAITALARYQLAGDANTNFNGTVSAGDVVMGKFDSSKPVEFKVADSSQPIRVQSEGAGKVYVSVTTRGLLKEESIKQFDNQLKARRRWLNKDGKEIDPASVKVGDLIYTEVSLSALALNNGFSVDNVAVVDALPGGFEVENPRLAVSASTGQREGDKPDRVEFLDDRVVLFASAGQDVKVFKYALRAISAGSFAIPPIQAECMYDPSFSSINGGGKVEIGK